MVNLAQHFVAALLQINYIYTFFNEMAYNM